MTTATEHATNLAHLIGTTGTALAGAVAWDLSGCHTYCHTVDDAAYYLASIARYDGESPSTKSFRDANFVLVDVDEAVSPDLLVALRALRAAAAEIVAALDAAVRAEAAAARLVARTSARALTTARRAAGKVARAELATAVILRPSVGRAVSAAEVAGAEAALVAANERCRERLYDWTPADTALCEEALALSARLGLEVRWHDDGGRVSCGSYRGRWTTTAVYVLAAPDGTLTVTASRHAGGSGAYARALLVVTGINRVTRWSDDGGEERLRALFAVDRVAQVLS